MEQSSEEIRQALVRQWDLISGALPSIDVERPSRIEGWRNREVLAHLSVQPLLLARFITKASATLVPEVSLQANLAGTHSLASMIDAATREAAEGTNAFTDNMRAAIPVLGAADLSTTITTFQGPIRLIDYLVTRCVEAVVHGCDITEPIEPDPTALAMTAAALTSVLASQHPELLPDVELLPTRTWVDAATGRGPVPPGLQAALPVMT